MIDIKIICMVCALIMACLMDLERYAISNRFLIGTGLLGLGITFCQDGLFAGAGRIAACVILIAALFPLFALHVLGAADIKLFAVIGCYYGIGFGFRCILWAFALGGFVSLLKIIRQREFRARLMWAFRWGAELLRSGKFRPYHHFSGQYEQDTIHFTWVILGGFFLTIWMSR